MSDETRHVKRLLASLRYPPMPEHLADRVDAAIAAEAEIRAGGEAMTRVSSGTALVRQAAKARAQSKVLGEDARKLAGLLGETEHAISRTMDRLASQDPVHAEMLAKMSRAATLGAAQATALA